VQAATTLPPVCPVFYCLLQLAIDAALDVIGKVLPQQGKASALNASVAVASRQLAAQVLSDVQLLPADPSAAARLYAVCRDTLASQASWALTAAVDGLRPTVEDVRSAAGQPTCHALIRLLVCTPPHRHHALCSQTATDTRSMVALLHRLKLLEYGSTSKHNVLRALDRLMQHAGGPLSSSGSAAATDRQPQQQQQQQRQQHSQPSRVVDEAALADAVLQHWGLRLGDVVAAAFAGTVGSAHPPVMQHIGICSLCGGGHSEDARLINCGRCVHAYHVACATDPNKLRLMRPDRQRLQAQPSVPRGLCLGCQGFPVCPETWAALAHWGTQLAATQATALQGTTGGSPPGPPPPPPPPLLLQPQQLQRQQQPQQQQWQSKQQQGQQQQQRQQPRQRQQQQRQQQQQQLKQQQGGVPREHTHSTAATLQHQQRAATEPSAATAAAAAAACSSQPTSECAHGGADSSRKRPGFSQPAVKGHGDGDCHKKHRPEQQQQQQQRQHTALQQQQTVSQQQQHQQAVSRQQQHIPVQDQDQQLQDAKQTAASPQELHHCAADELAALPEAPVADTAAVGPCSYYGGGGGGSGGSGLADSPGTAAGTPESTGTGSATLYAAPWANRPPEVTVTPGDEQQLLRAHSCSQQQQQQQPAVGCSGRMHPSQGGVGASGSQGELSTYKTFVGALLKECCSALLSGVDSGAVVEAFFQALDREREPLVLMKVVGRMVSAQHRASVVVLVLAVVTIWQQGVGEQETPITAATPPIAAAAGSGGGGASSLNLAAADARPSSNAAAAGVFIGSMQDRLLLPGVMPIFNFGALSVLTALHEISSNATNEQHRLTQQAQGEQQHGTTQCSAQSERRLASEQLPHRLEATLLLVLQHSHPSSNQGVSCEAAEGRRQGLVECCQAVVRAWSAVTTLLQLPDKELLQQRSYVTMGTALVPFMANRLDTALARMDAQAYGAAATEYNALAAWLTRRHTAAEVVTGPQSQVVP